MQNNDFRAKQFMPFDALKGHKEAIELIEKKGQNKKILLEDSQEELDRQLKFINKNNIIKVKYYDGFDYVETFGIIKKVDYINKCLYILNSKINFDDIVEILQK